MAFQIPSDLIRQVQTLIREEVGLSSYDPLDPTLPTVPSLRESIASFDQSASSLRCYHCKGNLLRGLQSAICVYCGKFQPKDALPDPINFKSTCGYKWLLQSLDLDGSETVISSIEESELSRRRTSKKVEVLLSDLLDLKITFHATSNKDDISLPEDEALHNKPSLDVSGNELDNFFPEPRQESGFHAFEEHPVEGKQVEKIENIDQVNLQNEKLTQFQKEEESFSGWEADFQFADSGNQHETSTSSSEPQLSSQVDLSAHLDSVFGSRKELYKGNSATNDWTQDDSWDKAKEASIHTEEGSQVNTAFKSGDGIIVDWFTNEQQQAGTINEPDNTWGDFADFTSTQYKRNGDQIDAVAAAQQERGQDFVDSINGWGDFSTEQKEEINFVRTKNAQEGDFGPTLSNTSFTHTKKDIYSNTANAIITPSTGEQEDGSLDDMWDAFTSSTVIYQPSGDHIVGFPEHRDEIHSVGTNNIQEINFDIFSVSDRSNAVDFGVVENKNIVEEDETGDGPNNLSRSPEVDIAASLMSQMHDLSFMLKDELSIP